MSLTKAICGHDQAYLDQSFPDTQIWNYASEHEPRFGANNSKDNKIYNLTQTAVNRSVLSANSALPVGFARSFQVSDLAQATTLLSVFDQYRIMQVEVWLKPQSASVGTQTATSLYTVLDYDDATTPISENQMQQYTNVTISAVVEGIYRRFRPHIAVAVYSGAFTSFKNELSDWIDSGSPNVQHYGFKALISPGPTTLAYDLEYRYWVQFRNVF